MTDVLGCQTVEEVIKKTVAIVRFGPPVSNAEGLKAGEYYQVTIDPEMFSACGQFIRFGSYRGDEITGWQKASAIYVLSVLQEFGEGDTEPPAKLRLWCSPRLEQLINDQEGAI